MSESEAFIRPTSALLQPFLPVVRQETTTVWFTLVASPPNFPDSALFLSPALPVPPSEPSSRAH